jgi:predicted nucleic acid-binding protein
MLVDANLLLYASLEDFPQHEAAGDWLDTQLNGPRRVGLPWPALLAFMRITTNARLFTSPLSTEAAWGRSAAGAPAAASGFRRPRSVARRSWATC